MVFFINQNLSHFVPIIPFSKYNTKGPYIKYVGEGGAERRVFVRVIRYFSHILMGFEIFFKIFDGPPNIFLCSISTILFFKLKALKRKISRLAIKEI